MLLDDSGDPVQNLARMIDTIDIAMLTTTTDDGQLESRPMATRPLASDGIVWFFASRTSHLVQSVVNHPKVNISYTDPIRQRYVSVSGSAAVLDDHVKRHAFWQPKYTTWFPHGVDDPDLILLRIQVDHADYWEAASSPVASLIGFSKALIGADHVDSVSNHGRLDL